MKTVGGRPMCFSNIVPGVCWSNKCMTMFEIVSIASSIKKVLLFKKCIHFNKRASN